MNTKASGKRKFNLSSPSVLLALAVVLAAAVTWGAFIYLQKREDSIKADLAAKQARNKTPKIAVVVPKADSKPGLVLGVGAFVAREVEEDLVYPDTVLARDFDSVAGAKLARSVLHGRPVRMSDLQPPEVKDIAALLKPGLRALTIEIDELNSISNTVRVGHKVDVFLISKAPKSVSDGGVKSVNDDGSQIQLYMQNVTILATGKAFQDPNPEGSVADKMARPGEVEGAHARDSNYSTVTVLVTPEDAQRLLLGKEMGTFRLALKGTKDSEDMRVAMLKTSDIDGSNEAKSRDKGIEYIVGGGKAAGMISSLPQPPSQKKSESMSAQAAASSVDPNVLQKAIENMTKPSSQKRDGFSGFAPR